jgi:hypothetical protein
VLAVAACAAQTRCAYVARACRAGGGSLRGADPPCQPAAEPHRQPAQIRRRDLFWCTERQDPPTCPQVSPPSPFAGGIYQVRLQFPDQYPEKPPRVRFHTNVFHPNVFADGTLCLDIIQDKWKPIYTVGTILTSIQVRGPGARKEDVRCERLPPV